MCIPFPSDASDEPHLGVPASADARRASAHARRDVQRERHPIPKRSIIVTVRPSELALKSKCLTQFASPAVWECDAVERSAVRQRTVRPTRAADTRVDTQVDTRVDTRGPTRYAGGHVGDTRQPIDAHEKPHEVCL